MNTKLVSSLLVMAVLIGCHGFVEDPTQQALYQLSVNRQKWQNKQIHDYSFDYDLAAMIMSHPLRIVVRSDTVSQVTDRQTGAVYTNAGNPTVDSLFAHAARLIANPDAGIRIQYNAPLGFPESITSNASVPDASYTITVSNLLLTP
jgi:hypothetical protein